MKFRVFHLSLVAVCLLLTAPAGMAEHTLLTSVKGQAAGITGSYLHQLETNFWLILAILLITAPAAMIYISRLKTKLEQDEEVLESYKTQWAHALDFLDDPIYMVDLDDRLIRANKAFFDKVGTSAEQAIGKKVTLFTHPEGEEIPCRVCQARKELLETTITLEPDDPANKSGAPTDITIKVIRDSEGKPLAIIQGMRDLTQARVTEEAIRQRENLFRGLLDTTPVPLLAVNEGGIISLVNSQFEALFGYGRDEIVGQPVEVLIPERFRENHLELRKGYAIKPSTRQMGTAPELVGLDKQGNEIPMEIMLSPFKVDNNTLTLAAIHDLSAQKQQDQQLKWLASIPEQNPMPIIEFSVEENRVSYLNKSARQRFPDIEDANLLHPLLKDIQDSLIDLNENENLVRDVEYNDVFYEQNIAYNPEKKLIRIYVWDITKLREMSQHMAYHASHDSLTSLPNRREFEHQLDRAIITASNENKHHVLCYMDLDQFKIVNDTCGHVAGDELLKQLAQVLKDAIRESDILARLGGDEFGLLLSGCSVEVAENIAEKIRRKIEEFRFHWDNKTFKIGISIGLVEIEQDSATLHDVLSAADTACYLAKERGRNRVHTYKVNDQQLSRHTEEMNWTHRIQHALENDHFILYSQEVIAIDKNKSGCHEILLRLRGDDGVLVPPSAFLSAAERFNLVTDIDLWVIKKSLNFFSGLKDSSICFSINLSGQTLNDTRAMSQIIQLITDSNIEPERICFEISETAMISNLSSARRFVEALKNFGCKIAMDDFGSGLSSFSYLKNLPVNYLKIDGDIIRKIDEEAVNEAMVESIIQVGHKMKLEIIAEFVESLEVLNRLKKLGINFVQGYHVAKPVPLEEITKNSNVIPMKKS